MTQGMNWSNAAFLAAVHARAALTPIGVAVKKVVREFNDPRKSCLFGCKLLGRGGDRLLMSQLHDFTLLEE
jgi:hypothetical protein